MFNIEYRWSSILSNILEKDFSLSIHGPTRLWKLDSRLKISFEKFKQLDSTLKNKVFIKGLDSCMLLLKESKKTLKLREEGECLIGLINDLFLEKHEAISFSNVLTNNLPVNINGFLINKFLREINLFFYLRKHRFCK